MSFIPSGTLDPHGAPVLRHDVLANSVTYVVGDALKLTTGFPVLATGGNVPIYGHLIESETNKGVGVNTTGAAGAAMGSYTNTYLTSSTNQTVLMARGVINISRLTQYSASVTGTPATGASTLGYMANLADEATIDQASALTTNLQYFIWGVDPNVSTRIIVSVHGSLIFGYDS